MARSSRAYLETLDSLRVGSGCLPYYGLERVPQFARIELYDVGALRSDEFVRECGGRIVFGVRLELFPGAESSPRRRAESNMLKCSMPVSMIET